MARERVEVVKEWPSGLVYVRRHDSKPGYAIVFKHGGIWHRKYRAKLEEALDLGEACELSVAVPGIEQPLYALVHHFLVVKRPSSWSDGYVETQTDYAAKWLEHDLGRRCATLDQTVPEQAIDAMRAAGRSAATENHFRSFWSRLVAHGKKWGFLVPTVDYQPRTDRRKDAKVVVIGDEHVIHRRDLPSWDDVLAQAHLAAERTGCWWEELRILFIASVGPRWGEHVPLTPRHFGLAELPDPRFSHPLEVGEVRINSKVNEDHRRKRQPEVASPQPIFTIDAYTKNGTVRITSHPVELDEMLLRRFAEVGSDGLLFPTSSPTAWLERCRKARRHVCGTPDEFGVCFESRHSWRQRVFIPTGLAVGWPIKGWRYPGAYRGRPRASSLAWTEHDYRHLAATTLLAPAGEHFTDGGGLDLQAVAAALGDTEETIQRRYLGRSDKTRGRIRSAVRRGR